MRAAESPMSFFVLATAATLALFTAPAEAQAGDAAVRALADRALRNQPPTVMEKTLTPSGWDSHDYSSPARYYWPDPAGPGLPWIRKDGSPDLEAIARSDEPRLAHFIDDVEALVAAWKAKGDAKYAARAALYLRAWFLDPATRMNPNFRGAQFIAGKDRGRGAGLIDFSGLWRLLDAASALEAWRDRPKAESDGLRVWMADYLAWLDSDAGAAMESRAVNNHGTWFAVQRVALLLFLGRRDDARSFLEAATARLAAEQFKSDGEQPLEAARADGISYSLFNLEAWKVLAGLADRAGARIDLSGPARASAFIAPYLSAPSTWPWSQKTPLARGAGAFLARAPWEKAE